MVLMIMIQVLWSAQWKKIDQSHYFFFQKINIDFVQVENGAATTTLRNIASNMY